MTADPSIAPGNEEPLMVIDWVKDYLPTGGELGAEIAALFGPDREQQLQIPHLQNRPARSSDNAFTTQSASSTTDEKEVKRLKEVQPEYKVRRFPPSGFICCLLLLLPSLLTLSPFSAGLALGHQRSGRGQAPSPQGHSRRARLGRFSRWMARRPRRVQGRQGHVLLRNSRQQRHCSGQPFRWKLDERIPC
jgi:hypothetical protein